MPILFNTILVGAGISPTAVRLIRHKHNEAERGRGPYELWRDNRQLFELYQSIQNVSNRKKLSVPYWAVFVVNHNDETMFAGMYSVVYRGLLKHDMPRPHMEGVDKAGTVDIYELRLREELSDLIGKLFIDWGAGALAWIQYADRHNKPLTELRSVFKEDAFPGFLDFIQPLSKLPNIPNNWISALKSAKGIYLLTCPRTKEQYVGSATGEDGFWGRWLSYSQSGHGGNLGLKSRDPSDYQVSILEVAGSSATPEIIKKMEGRWQVKLQSREMGLNRNRAG